MKFLIIFAGVILSNLASPSSDTRVLKLWNQFKVTHQKQYSKAEELNRLKIFEENLKKIEQHNKLYNKGEVTYSMIINQFADMTNKEFRNYLIKFKNNPIPTVTHRTYSYDISLPDSVDWATKGAVTPVKNQGSCGSCWSFSTTGSLEAANFLKTGKLISFSEQELVDCSNNYGNLGCSGGLMKSAFAYISDYGLATEESYPYRGDDGDCNEDVEKAIYVSGFGSVKKDNETALQEAVATIGPISVAIDASYWQFYHKGIYYDAHCSADELNHGVLVVGYGIQDDNNEYWLIKNSWGADWGEEGYMKAARNRDNNCGIARQACFPIL